MNDLISRKEVEQAIKEFNKKRVDRVPRNLDMEVHHNMLDTILAENTEMLEIIENLPTTCIGNNSWIPVSERIPNEEEMKQAYCRNHYGGEFIVMIEGANKPTTLYRTMDGFWVNDERVSYKVSAWMPLPKPYTGENNE